MLLAFSFETYAEDMDGGNICILCREACEENEKLIKLEDWEKLKQQACKWKNLDKYGEVFDTVDWQAGPISLLWHKGCKREICGERKLQQAINRKRKSDECAIQELDEVERGRSPVPLPKSESQRDKVSAL